MGIDINHSTNQDSASPGECSQLEIPQFALSPDLDQAAANIGGELLACNRWRISSTG